MDINLRALRAKIKGFSAESSTTNRRIAKASHQKKAQLWDEKRSLGALAREHLVAYALLRGKSYVSIEPRCRRGNEPHCSAILKLIHEHGSAKDRLAWTLERVTSALTRT